MSLMSTLAKVAIGVAVAKGVGSVMKGRAGQAGSGSTFGGSQSPQASGGTGLEGMMGSILGGQGGGSGGLGDLMGKLGGAGGASAQSGGGLGGLLNQLGGAGGASGGGLDSLLGGLGGAAGAGGLGGLLGSLAGQGQQKPQGQFGDMLNQAFERQGEPDVPPTPQQDAAAGLMLRAMIQAAKSDGKIDEAEREKLIANLGDDVSAAERDFVNEELAAPVDIAGLVAQVPQGMEQQIYVMSLLGIDLDAQAEAQYLHELGSALGLSQQTVNGIHSQMGAPALYA